MQAVTETPPVLTPKGHDVMMTSHPAEAAHGTATVGAGVDDVLAAVDTERDEAATQPEPAHSRDTM